MSPKLIRASLCAAVFAVAFVPAAVAQARHNVIIFVADGLRRNSVDAENMPTFLAVRRAGVDFRNSHSSFPTFTTANASIIATGHGLGDTGDYSNALYPGVWLSKPDDSAGTGFLVPFLENDAVLASMNAAYNGNYLGEKTLLTYAREKGFHVASVGKVGPTAIQQIGAVSWDAEGRLATDAIIVDDATGLPNGVPLPLEIRKAMEAAGLPAEVPLRNNGHGESSQWNNAFTGDAKTPGTLAANVVQEQWMADVTTKVLLPRFTSDADAKPFVLLFWSRDPDGSQHDEGDSLQNLSPGINGETSKRGLRNADRCLRQLLDWLDAHPAVKAKTDVLLTSDHGFATVSRREISADGAVTGEVSGALDYDATAKEAAETKGTLPTGFLAVDLAVRGHMNVFDPALRATAGPSVFQQLNIGGEHSQHPSNGSAVLGESVQHLDGSDARLIVASNGGSDMIYVPSGSKQIVKETLALLGRLDYVGGLFVDDKYCTADADCPGALRMSTVGLVGASKVPRPAIVVTYKNFLGKPGDLQSGVQVSDTSLQEGQGMHGGFGRDQTFNNMAAMGPDFKRGFADEEPMGNIDIVPTLARILGLDMPATGKLRGRVLAEAMSGGAAGKVEAGKTMVSVPAESGLVTVLEYQQKDGVTYLDRACFLAKDAAKKCQ